MAENYNPFKQPFLQTFSVIPEKLPLSEKFLKDADTALADYEKTEISWRLEKALRQRNSLLASFAVSKAENSNLTLAEASEIYNSMEKGIVEELPDFLQKKLAVKAELTEKDHDRLEYHNIIKTFKDLTSSGLKIADLTPELILNLHRKLTANLDLFAGKLPNFETYNSGHLRDDDNIRVEEYVPAPYKEIAGSLEELIAWLKEQPSAINIFIFHAALYALHPFKNGNKRVCRVLEHFLLQDIGYNSKDLYSTSYYYHKHRNRYYKELLEALYKRNLNFFVAFASEALFFSIVGVKAAVLQRKKLVFLTESGLDKNVIKVLKPLIKHRELRFSRFYALAKRKVAKQTFSNYIKEADGVIERRSAGKYIYYSLAGNYPEEETLAVSLREAREKINYLPDEFIGYL
jgi:Fic family protein